MGKERGEGSGETPAFPDEEGAAFITSSLAPPALVSPRCLAVLTLRPQPGCLVGLGLASGRLRGSPARVRDESAGRHGRGIPRRGCERSGAAEELGPGQGRLGLPTEPGE